MSMTDHLMELLLSQVYLVLKQANIDDAQALARKIVDAIKSKLGGGDLYIPVLDIEKRNAEILASFNGRNYADLCKRYRISLRTLYRILSK